MLHMYLTTSADRLARATYNALLYADKKPPFDMAMIVAAQRRVTFLTTNSYALSAAHCEADAEGLEVDEIAFKIDVPDLKALEARCREGKKERCVLDFDLRSHEIWYRGEEPQDDLRMEDVFEDGIDNDSWDEINLALLRELIEERREDPNARMVLLNPEYLRKLAQAKKDKNQGAHFWFSGERDTVLIKVGADHEVLIEPIDPERHASALGEEAVWKMAG